VAAAVVAWSPSGNEIAAPGSGGMAIDAGLGAVGVELFPHAAWMLEQPMIKQRIVTRTILVACLRHEVLDFICAPLR
jgi:hypothetical protein